MTTGEKRIAISVALVPLLLGDILLLAGFRFRRKEGAGIRSVAAREILDRAAVPAGGFVTVTGTIGKSGKTYGRSDSPLLFALKEFALQEEPTVVVVCSSASSYCNEAALHERHQFTGRLYDGGHYEGSSALPTQALEKFAEEELKLASESGVRVVSLDETPAVEP